MSVIMESCSREELCTALGSNEKVLDQLRSELEDWLKLQPHLPQDASRKRLESFILGSKMSLEIAKQKLDMYYTIRGLIPEFFANRDPRGPAFSLLHNASQYVCLPKQTAEKCIISVSRALTDDASKADPWQIVKYMLMISDIQMHERCYLGQIYVFDLAMMNLGHMKSVTLTLLQKYQLIMKGYPVRVKGFYFINAPSFIDRLVFMIKSVLSAKLAARVHVYTAENLESFYQDVPKSVLPKDYGGDQPSMDELSDVWRKKLEEWRDWFLEQDNLLVDERLRPVSIEKGENLFGSDGSFRKLDID